MLFLLPLGSGMEELVQHQPRDSFPDYKKRKPCLLLIWFGILRSNFPVGSIRFHPIPSILRLITRNRILSHWWYFLLNEKIGLVFLYPPATPVWEWFYINGEPPNKEVAPWKSLFAAKPFSYFLGKNPFRFKNSPNWDIHSEPETITNEKEGVRKGLRKNS